MTSLPPAVGLRPPRHLQGSLELPGDKSIAHRALIVAALASGPCSIQVRSAGRDLRSTVDSLRRLGVSIEEDSARETSTFAFSGHPWRDAEVDCGNSGTTMRLLAGAVAGLPLRVTLDGDASLRRRPMERVVSVLRAAGAAVMTRDGRAPMRVVGRHRLRAVEHRLPVPSAQLVAAAAFGGLAADGATRIVAPGPTRDHTERLLASVGVAVSRRGQVTTVHGPARPEAFSMTVPGDASAAAPWLVAAAVHPSAEIILEGVGLNPTRTALIGLLRRMGAQIDIEIGEEGVEPTGRVRIVSGRELRAVRIAGTEAAELIDELPLVAIAMAAANGTSELRGAAELRVKESDRIAATVAGLGAIGAFVEELPDGWRVRRGRARRASVITGGDHRIAMAFAVAALSGVAESVELDDPACVAISYPSFWSDVARVST